MKRIILISGKAESGKDTTAKLLQQKLKGKSLIIHYSDYLKFICQTYFGWNGIKDEYGRNLLQSFGTEKVRKRNPNFWVDAVCRLIDILRDDFDYFIIPDTRFPNEIDLPIWFFGRGRVITIRVERLNYTNTLTRKQQNHPSETALDNYLFDYYIRSESGIDKLEKEIDKILLLGGSIFE